MRYADFLHGKSQLGSQAGFDPLWMPDFLFDFQRSLVEWSIRKGRAAIFADCGLGKTPMQLVWAENVVRKTNKPVLIITPLAVSHQTVREAEKFSIEAARSGDGKLPGHPCIVVTNYERLHFFDPSKFDGVVCDESSILKNFKGATKAAITEFMREKKYRLLCTATAAPNDYIELGTSSEALGELGYMDMLGMFFKNDQGSLNPMRSMNHQGSETSGKWRFKAHAETDFWRWVCSWARALRKPSDLGFDDSKFILPKLEVRETIVEASRPMPGFLFKMPAVGLKEQRLERRCTIEERCEAVAKLVDDGKTAVVWCHLNPEGDLLEDLIPDAVQVSGADHDDAKEEKFEAFVKGQTRVMVIKPKIGAFGLNWAHCSHATFFPSHSFEQYYQGVRRCWRFGQKRKVLVDIVTTEGEHDVMANLQRKADAADAMFTKIVGYMRDALTIEHADHFPTKEKLPSWLKGDANARQRIQPA